MANTLSKSRKFRGNSTITLYVGESKVPFHIHDDVLFAASPVFKAAFSSKFKEASERTMELPDEDAEMFEQFIDCVYAKRFENPDSKDLIKNKDFLMQTAQIYVLAEKYEVEMIKVSLCKEIFISLRGPHPGRYLENMAGPSREARKVLGYLDQNTSPNTLLRKVIGDWLACCAPWHEYTDKPRSLRKEQERKELVEWLREHPDFGVPLAFAMAKKAVGDAVSGHSYTCDHVFSWNVENYMTRIQEQD